MDTPMQMRLNRMGLGTRKPPASETQGPQSIPRWQQELDDYKRNQEALSKPLTPANDAELTSSATSKSKDNKTSAGRSFNTRKGRSHVPGSNPDEILFLPKGLVGGDPSDVQLDEDDEYESDKEPESSSVDLVGTFCLFSQVIKFPYKYMQDPEDGVSQSFFARGKAFEREWKLYYINPPDDLGWRSIFLVPQVQVKNLVNEISAKFKVTVEVPPYPFTMSFFKDGTPKPQFLGIVNSKEDFDSFKSSVPSNPSDYAVLPARATKIEESNHAAWREKVGRALAAEQKKKGAIKKKKRERQAKIIMEHCDQLKRTQRYLGLRSPLPTTQIVRPTTDEDGSQFQQIRDIGLLPDQLDVDKSAEFPFEDEVVIVAFDVESWEENHAMITEIGISTLDTTKLVNVPPGHQGENWIKTIRSRHFRITGREYMRNFKYCTGHPESFQFGISEFVAIDGAPGLVDSCFEWPYSAGFECQGPPQFDADGNPTPRPEPGLATTQITSNHQKQRNLLILGHDITGDIAYLSSLGSEIFGPDTTHASINSDNTPSRRQRVLSSIRERLDTSILHKTLNKDDQIRSLTKMCYDLDITAWYAHNAGNDARYTLEAFIKLAIKARQQDDAANKLAQESGSFNTHATLWQLEKEMRVQAKMEAARKEVEEELKAWEKGGAPGCQPRPDPSPRAAAPDNDDSNTMPEKANNQQLENGTVPSLQQAGSQSDHIQDPTLMETTTSTETTATQTIRIDTEFINISENGGIHSPLSSQPAKEDNNSVKLVGVNNSTAQTHHAEETGVRINDA